MKEIVTIFGISINLEQFHQEFPQYMLSEAVHPTSTVLVRQDESQSRVEVVAYFLTPPTDESLNNVPPLLMGRKRCCTGVALLPCLSTGLLLSVLERIEELQEEL